MKVGRFISTVAVVVAMVAGVPEDIDARRSGQPRGMEPRRVRYVGADTARLGAGPGHRSAMGRGLTVKAAQELRGVHPHPRPRHVLGNRGRAEVRERFPAYFSSARRRALAGR